MKNLEVFLKQASEKINNLTVTTDTGDFENYKVLTIVFNDERYKIRKDFIDNFDNYYKKSTDAELLDFDVDPYKNMGSIKEIKNVASSEFVEEEDKVYTIIESIIDDIYKEYNFLVLPPLDCDVDEINVDDYIKQGIEYNVEPTKEDSNVNQNLYSIGFKFKAVNNENETEYFPFKCYFRINDDLTIEIDDSLNEYNNKNILEFLGSKITSKKNRAKLDEMLYNNKFDEQKNYLSENLDKIINGIFSKITSYWNDFENAPKWFKESKLGNYYIKQDLSGEKREVNASASFRYITQTPLPYQYSRVTFKNVFDKAQIFDVKMSSQVKKMNDSLNKCPICKKSINSENKLVISDEYDPNMGDSFVGCETCMTCKCDLCNNVWSKDKEPVILNKKPKDYFLYKAGKCAEPDFCLNNPNLGCVGKNLCSKHSVSCDDSRCEGLIYCANAIVPCASYTCNKKYCKSCSTHNLHFCQTSVCSKKPIRNGYCDECSKVNLHTCSYCGKNMCDDDQCKVNVINKDLSKSNNEFICIDCYMNLTSDENRNINIQNKVLLKDKTGKYLPISRKKVQKYIDRKDQYIASDIATPAYYESKKSENKKLYFREKDVTKCACCKELFYVTQKEDEPAVDDNKYCKDCLVVCAICGKLTSDSHAYLNGEEYYCNRDTCYNKEWLFSDLNLDNEIIENKDNKTSEVFVNQELGEKYKLLPVKRTNFFKDPIYKKDVDIISQTRVCKNCNIRYSLLSFDGDSSSCELCEKMKNQDAKTNSNNKKLLYSKKYGDIKDFNSIITDKMILIKTAMLTEAYTYNEKTGKYVLDNSLLGEKEKEE